MPPQLAGALPEPARAESDKDSPSTVLVLGDGGELKGGFVRSLSPVHLSSHKHQTLILPGKQILSWNQRMFQLLLQRTHPRCAQGTLEKRSQQIGTQSAEETGNELMAAL